MTLPSPAWLVLDTGAGEPAWNMALDQALLETAAARGRPLLRFYCWSSPALTFGYFQRYAAVAPLAGARPCVRRPTGGGVVIHDDDWTYSVVIPPADPWYSLRAADSYRFMHDWIRQAFQHFDVRVELAQQRAVVRPGECFAGAEIADVVLGGAKIAGAAQRRSRQGLLIQGSLQPAGLTIPRSQWHQAMLEVARRQWGVEWSASPLSSDLLGRAAALAESKYASPERAGRGPSDR